MASPRSDSPHDGIHSTPSDERGEVLIPIPLHESSPAASPSTSVGFPRMPEEDDAVPAVYVPHRAPGASRKRVAIPRGITRPAVVRDAGRLALGLLACAVLVAGIATVLDLTKHTPHLGALVSEAGRVVLVYPDSPVAATGLRPGDTITAIDNLPFGDARLSPLAHARGTVGVTVGAPGSRLYFPLAVAAPTPTSLDGDGAALAAAFALWVSGLVAGAPRRRRLAGRLYALAAFAFALALCALVGRDSVAFWPWPVLTPALLAGLGALLLAAVGQAGPLPRPLAALVALVVAVAGLVAIFGAYRTAPVPGAVVALVPVALTFLAIAALVAPLFCYVAAPAEPRRQRLRVVTVAGIIGLLPVMLWPGVDALRAFAGTADASVPGIAGLSPLWGTVGLIPMAAFYGLLSVGDDARRLDGWARAAMSYLVAAVLVATLYAVLTAIFPAIAPGILLLAALIPFPFVRRGIEAALAHAVARPRPDYVGALRLIEDATAVTTTTRALASGVAARLPAYLHVRSAAVLVRGLDCPADRYRVIDGGHAGDTGGAGDVVRLDGALEIGSPDEAMPIVTPGLTVATGTPHQFDVALWAPLWWNGGQRGVLALGPRLSGESFDAADVRQVAGLAGVLALALNAQDLVGRLRERTAALSHAHERERAHLSHELHDVVAQELIALTRQLRRYGHDHTPPPDIWADMVTASQDALTATRRICNGLRPAILDLGLAPALRDLVEDAGERHPDTRVRLVVDGADQRLPAEMEFALFRVAQEGLNNALEHGRAAEVLIEAGFGDGVVVRVRDDGRGFVVPSRFEDLPGDHLGLIGMRERLAEFDGTLRVVSAPGRGALLEASIPHARYLSATL